MKKQILLLPLSALFLIGCGETPASNPSNVAMPIGSTAISLGEDNQAKVGELSTAIFGGINYLTTQNFAVNAKVSASASVAISGQGNMGSNSVSASINADVTVAVFNSKKGELKISDQTSFMLPSIYIGVNELDFSVNVGQISLSGEDISLKIFFDAVNTNIYLDVTESGGLKTTVTNIVSMFYTTMSKEDIEGVYDRCAGNGKCIISSTMIKGLLEKVSEDIDGAVDEIDEVTEVINSITPATIMQGLAVLGGTLFTRNNENNVGMLLNTNSTMINATFGDVIPTSIYFGAGALVEVDNTHTPILNRIELNADMAMAMAMSTTSSMSMSALFKSEFAFIYNNLDTSFWKTDAQFLDYTHDIVSAVMGLFGE